MPPKEKAAKEKKPTVTKETLEEDIVRLREELDRERDESNYFQLERDKIHTFWEIGKRHLEESKADLRNRDSKMEEQEERHQVEIKVYKQKVKHLVYEHQNSICEWKEKGMLSTKLMQEQQDEAEGELHQRIRALTVDLKEKESPNQNEVKERELKSNEDLTKTRNEFERQVREIEVNYERKMGLLRQEQDLRRKAEVHDIETRKDNQISTLIKNHKKDFGDMKDYYNQITTTNLLAINTQKDLVVEMKKKDECLEKDMAEVVLENKKLKGPLVQAQEDLAELRKSMVHYATDKGSLALAKARLKVGNKEYKDLKLEHGVLVQRFSKLQAESDELYTKFTQAIQEVQQKSGFKNLLLERKIEGLTDTLEKKEALLNEVLRSATNLDPTALGVVTHNIEDILDFKNIAIKDLQYELAKAKGHNQGRTGTQI